MSLAPIASFVSCLSLSVCSWRMFLLMSSCLSGLRASFRDSDSLRAIFAANRPAIKQTISLLIQTLLYIYIYIHARYSRYLRYNHIRTIIVKINVDILNHRQMTSNNGSSFLNHKWNHIDIFIEYNYNSEINND